MRGISLVGCLVLGGCLGRHAFATDGGGDSPSDGGAVEDLASVEPSGGFVGRLGAIPHDGGVSFRVWAPGADQVTTVAEFGSLSLTASANEPGVFEGESTEAQIGQRYHYEIHRGSDLLQRVDPRARRVDGKDGLIVDPRYRWAAAWQAPPAEQRVIYELHLGTFDGTTHGTFASAADKLDYLAALGVNMLEIMPPAHFPSKTSWGYNLSLPFAIAKQYGTPEDVRRFVDAAHGRGMGVIIDVVYNHWDSVDLNCFDGDCGAQHGIYFYSDSRGSTPWGPRPDFGRDQVRDYIRENALLWLDEYRCDGLRWDSVSNIRGINNGATPNPDGESLLKSIMDAIHTQFPASLQIAEDLQTIDYVTTSTAHGGLGFDSQWDAAFFHPVDDNTVVSADSSRSMAAIAGAINHRYHNNPLERVVYSEDHDEVANGRQRIPEMISPGNAGSLVARQRSTVAAAIVMTSPGIPMIFMGQEFLENGWFSDTNPLDWSKTVTYSGILAEYQDLIALRKNAGGVTAGLTGDNVNVYHVNDGAKVIAYHRWKNGGPGDDVIVVANYSAKAFPIYDIGLPRPGIWHARFHSDDKKYSPDYADTPTPDVTTTAMTRDGLAQQGRLQLGPYEVLILSQ